MDRHRGSIDHDRSTFMTRLVRPPESQLATALASAHAGHDGAWDALAALRDRAQPGPDPVPTLLATAALVMTAHHVGRYDGIQGCVDDLLPLRNGTFSLEPCDELLALNGLLIGLLLYYPRDPFVERCAGRLLELIESGLDINLTLAAARTLIYHFDSCDARESAMSLNLLLEARLNDPLAQPFRVAEWLNLWRRCAHYSKQPHQARKVLDRMRAYAQLHGLRRIEFVAALADLDSALPRGDVAAAKLAIAQAEGLSDPHRLRETMQLEFAKSRFARMRNRVDAAVDHAARASRIAAELKLPPIMRAAYAVNEAQAMLLNENFEGARAAMVGELDLLPAGYADEVSAMVEGIDAYLAVTASSPQANERLGLLWNGLRNRRSYDLFEGFPEFGARLCVMALQRNVEVDFVRHLIEKCGLVAPLNAPANWPWALRIEALGGFAIYRDDIQLSTEGKAPRKPIALLHALIALGGLREERGVEIQRLIDLLWPDDGAADPRSSFEAALSRLRKWLGVEGALKISDGRLSLNARLAWCDVDAFENVCDSLQAAASPHADGASIPELVGRLGALYRGKLFGVATLEPWSVMARERLAMRFARSVSDVGLHLETHRQWSEAVRFYEASLVQDMLAESIHRALMRCHLTLGHRAEAQQAFECCRRVLASELRLEPSLETRALMEQAGNRQTGGDRTPAIG